MSKKAVLEFVESIRDNPALVERLRSKGASYSNERYANAVVVGKELGFGFTEEGLKAIADDAFRYRDGELSDTHLDAVVGGLDKQLLGQLIRVINGGTTPPPTVRT